MYVYVVEMVNRVKVTGGERYRIISVGIGGVYASKKKAIKEIRKAFPAVLLDDDMNTKDVTRYYTKPNRDGYCGSYTIYRRSIAL